VVGRKAVAIGLACMKCTVRSIPSGDMAGNEHGRQSDRCIWLGQEVIFEERWLTCKWDLSELKETQERLEFNMELSTIISIR
jgi:hypothetical protein